MINRVAYILRAHHGVSGDNEEDDGLDQREALEQMLAETIALRTILDAMATAGSPQVL